MNFIKYCLCLLLCSLFSIGTNQENRVYSQIPHFVSSLVYSPDGTMIAVSSGEAGCLDYTGSFPIPIYDASSGQPIKTLLGMNCTATGLSWSSDSAYLLGIRGPDSKIYIWNVVTDELELSFFTNTQGISMALWSPDGTTIAGSFGGNSILFWDPNNGQRADYDFGGTTFDWSTDGAQIVRGSQYNNVVRITDVATQTDIKTLDDASDVIYALDWSADGNRIAAVSGTDNAIIWNATTGQITLSLVVSELSSVVWSPDSQMLATSSYDGTLRIWDANTGNLLETHSNLERLRTVTWSSDGSQLAFSTDASLLEIVDAPSLCDEESDCTNLDV